MSKPNILLVGKNDFYGTPIKKLLASSGVGKSFSLPKEVCPSDCPNLYREFLLDNNITSIIDVGGLSYGIQGNIDHPAELFLDNLQSINSIRTACKVGVKKYVFYGSSCCYPRAIGKPMKPHMLNSGPLEPTNHAYACVKLAGMELCKAISKEFGYSYHSIIPANIYGPLDDFSDKNSHVVGALIKRFSEAVKDNESVVRIWGTGLAKRDFLYIDDLARATLAVLEKFKGSDPINVGSNCSTEIVELARLISDAFGFSGELRFDAASPDGMPVKVLDSQEIIDLGWRQQIDLKQGLSKTIEWFLSERNGK